MKSSDETRAGFDAYARHSRNRLLGQAYRLSNSWDEAEDLVQLTLWRLFRHWDQLADRSQLGAYASRTLLNVFLSARRSRRWQAEVLVPALPEICAQGVASDDRMALAAVVKQLPEGQQKVIMLRYWGDMSVDQTARALGCSVGNVTSQTYRALHALRSLLKFL